MHVVTIIGGRLFCQTNTWSLKSYIVVLGRQYLSDTNMLSVLRSRLEQAEAWIWKKILIQDVTAPSKEVHSYLFNGLSRIELLPVHENDSGICDACGEPASFKCSGCFVGLYCCKEHQAEDWKKNHKNRCRAIREALSITEQPWEFDGTPPSPDPAEFAGMCYAKSAEKPYCVLVMLDNAPHSVFMSKEDMIDYDRFICAIQSVVPKFRKVEDLGWQHWQTVREAWNH